MNSAVPFVHCFKTINGFYFYDVNKDTIVSVDEAVFNWLNGDFPYDSLDDRTKARIEGMKAKGLLSDKRVKVLRHIDTKNIHYKLENQVEMMILQVTQACNLTCSYCPYAYKGDKVSRSHSNKMMSWEIAKQAIDFYYAHSKDMNEVCITYYGGEPFLNFPVIKKSVEYAQELFLGKGMLFRVTTNGTVLTDEVIDFLVQNEFDVTFSIDGPASVHDVNRKQANGKGSFDLAFENMKKLVNAYGDSYKGHISMNTVINPEGDPSEVFSLFDDPIFKEHEIELNVNIADDDMLNTSFVPSKEFRSFYSTHGTAQLYNLLGLISERSLNEMDKKGVLNYQRKLEEYHGLKGDLPDEASPSGPCMPGKRRLFVDTEGFFYPCERVNEQSEILRIGSVYDGFDEEKVSTILNICNLSPEECRNCFAFRHCSICVKSAEYDGELSAEVRRKSCERVRATMERELRVCTLMKEYREKYAEGDHGL
ncbi:MAG: radical SAM protein [Lachnospiraceae bacterium]|nr:radical SAM protein [Lachnospiraceae bacterium]